MFNPAILKKKKSALADREDSKPMMVGKKAMNYAMESMSPEMEDEDKEEGKSKKMGPEAKIEIELMLNGAKKKKGN
jgi:hypothetical protein